jgi:NAD(P)H-nitrite reductase large subunit
MDFSAEDHDGQGRKLLCHCLGIHAEDVKACIVEQDLMTVRQVTKACGAGGGCTSCHRHIKRLLHEHTVQKGIEAAAKGPLPVESLLGCA